MTTNYTNVTSNISVAKTVHWQQLKIAQLSVDVKAGNHVLGNVYTA